MKKRKKPTFEMRTTTIRVSKEFEERVEAFIAGQITRESFNSALIKLATFALLFFKTTKRIDMKVLEQIQTSKIDRLIL